MKDISLHIMDIVQNSVRAHASLISVRISDDVDRGIYSLTIKDNGVGMDKQTLQMSTDPFFTSRSTRKIGMGIPLLKQNALRTGGDFMIDSEPGKGTLIRADFGREHIDFLPEGDLSGVIAQLAAGNPSSDICFTYESGNMKYDFDTREIKAMLGEVPIHDADIYSAIGQLISENIHDIKNEIESSFKKLTV